ncbi:MAG: NADPH-dependent assimilatory sulfite reductase hemoprotein subunit [Holophagaceae bacterium]
MSTAEDLKAGSDLLRGALADELASPVEKLSADASQLVKFHGLYQQRDRDKAPEPRPHVLMVRGRIPGGRLTPAQWAAWDRLADTYGDGTLRLTTRQGVELHGVLKGDAKATLQALHAALLTTKGACGDVVRNVMEAPNPSGRADLAQLGPVAQQLSDHFQAKSNAYAEVWLDGAKVDGPEAEPLYGKTYLPRKFKIAVTLAGDNSVDAYTQDLAFVGTLDGRGRIDGWFVLAGGGMGMTHGDASTFPRLADGLGWIPADALLPVAEAVVTIQRDHGNRLNRRRARLKYLLHDRGLAWFKGEVEARAGLAFEELPLPPWRTPSPLGWTPRADGSWALGFHTLSGRVQGGLKRTLAELVAAHGLDVQLTPDQDLILLGIHRRARASVEAFLAARGVAWQSPSKLHDRALACVALPLCAVAITEAERVAPDVTALVNGLLAKHDLEDRAPLFRITGCANGCARPYAAELALVGQTAGRYAVFAGGDTEGTRLAFPVADRVATADLAGVLDRLFAAWKAEGGSGEPFGDFATRLGAAALARRLRPDPALAFSDAD